MRTSKTGRGPPPEGQALASACCLGPLVLITLGVSGARISNLAALEPYRPLSASRWWRCSSPGVASSQWKASREGVRATGQDATRRSSCRCWC